MMFLLSLAKKLFIITLLKKFSLHIVHRVLILTISISKLLFVKCLRNALLMNQAILILLQVQWLMFQQLMKQMIKLKQELKPVKKILRRQLIFLFLWVSQKLLLQQIHSFRLHHSRKQQEFKGKSDPLIGLKENVIIGKLVPAGTGMDVFRKVDVVPSYFSAENSDEILNLEQLQELLTNTMQ